MGGGFMKRALLLAVLTLAACDDTIPGMCKSDSDCIAPAYCYREFCVFDEDWDGGTDAAAVDAGPADASDNDAGGDAGSLDGSQSSTDGGAVGITSFTATPAIITQGQGTTLAWTLSEAWSASIDQGIGPVSGSSVTVTPSSDTTYTLTASNAAGSISSAKLTVHVVPPPKIASFSATPSVIAGGKTSTLSWSTTGAASLTIDNGIGAVTGTSVTVNPTSTTTYTLKAANAAGATDSATTTVTLDLAPPTLTIDSPATDATCGSTCTGAVFNLASSASVIFQGKAQDENGRALTDGLVATLDGQPATVFTSGSSWQFTWQNLPAENGKFHTFTVVATDVAGNKATASRTIYVDRVAPTCSGTQDGKRLISRTATLLQCSEPMDVASVQANTALAPAASGITSSDGMAFGFSNPSALQAYQSYSLSLASTAKDKAGNAVATSLSQRFLTEPIMPPTQVSFKTAVGDNSPVFAVSPIALDQDGKPLVIATVGTYASGLSVKALRWDGRGAWQVSVLPMYAQGPCPELPCYFYKARELTIVSSITPALELATDYYVLAEGNNNGSIVHVFSFVHSIDFVNWTGLGTSTPNQLGGFPVYQGTNFFTEHSGSTQTVSILTPKWVNEDFPPTSTIQVVRANPNRTGWQAPVNLTPEGSSLRIFGNVYANTAGEFYSLPSNILLPFHFGSAITDFVFHSAQQVMTSTSSGFTPLGSAVLGWSEFKSSANESYPTLFLACAHQPSSTSSWNRSLDLSPIPGSDRNNNEHPEAIHIALSEKKIGVLLSTDRKRFYVGRLDNTDCSGAPASPAWTSAISQASQASIAIDHKDTLWRAWMDLSSSDLSITH
jgi:hypothetical protein